MKLSRLLAPVLGALALALMSLPALAQCSGTPSANTVCAGPPSGVAGQFRTRALVAADVHTGSITQAWDADLDALAALSGTNTIYYRSAPNIWSAVNVGSFLSFSAGTLNIGDAELTAIGGLTSANNKCFYWTGSGTASNYDCSSFGRSVANAADAAALRTLAGAVIGTDVQAFDADLAALAGLTSAAGKVPYFTGSGTASLFDSTSFGRSVSNVADATALRALAGAVIGTNVQAWDADLDALAALSGTSTIYYRSAANTWTAVTIGGLLSFSAGTLNVGDAELAAIAGLTSANNKCFYWTGLGTAATFDCSSFGRSVTNVADAAALRTLAGSVIGTDVQAFDAELAALAGLTSANNKCFYWTGLGTAATFDCSSFGRSVTSAADAAALRTLAGAVIGTNVQAWDADLDALAANSTDGFWAHTGVGTGAARTFTAPAAGFTITNPAGIAGNPTFVLANDLGALEALASTGFAVRTASDTWAQRTIAGTTNEVCVSNGTGVSGDPTLGICSGFLSTAHSWAGAQTLASPIFTGTADSQGAVTWSGDISPAQLVANTNDWAPTGFSTASAIRFSTDASRNITGLAGGADGRIVILHNVGSFSAVLTNEDASSTAANRFLFGGDMTLATNTSVTLRYDATSSRWRAITSPGSGGGGGGGTVTSVTVAGAGLTSASGTIPITGSGTVTLTTTAAVKSDQTTASSTAVAVVPAVQQNHPSAAKAWAYCTNSGGTYTLQASYNISGGTCGKTGTGLLTLTFSTAFTSANYVCQVTVVADRDASGQATTLATGTVALQLFRNAAGTLSDQNFNIVCYGTQ